MCPDSKKTLLRALPLARRRSTGPAPPAPPATGEVLAEAPSCAVPRTRRTMFGAAAAVAGRGGAPAVSTGSSFSEIRLASAPHRAPPLPWHACPPRACHRCRTRRARHECAPGDDAETERFYTYAQATVRLPPRLHAIL